MAKKTVKLGSLIVNEVADKRGGKKKLLSLALGNKAKNNNFSTTVELTVKDHKGKVVYSQTNGYISLIDPRTQADDLLSAGLIGEEVHAKMKSNTEKLSEKVKYVMEVRVDG